MFHVNADAINIDPESLVVQTKNKAGSNLEILAAGSGNLAVTDQAREEKPYVQGWVRQGNYGVRPIPTPVYRLESAGASRMAFLLYPLREGKTCPVRGIKLAAGGAGQASTIELTGQGGKTQRITLDSQKERAVQFGN
jgi:hypothetical protein